MRLSTLFVIAAVISLAYGIGLLAIPQTMFGIYGVTTDVEAELAARYLGGVLLGYVVINWMARNAADSQARRAIVVGETVANAATCLVAVYAGVAGLGNALIWSAVVLFALMALAFGYFAFAVREPASQMTPATA